MDLRKLVAALLSLTLLLGLAAPVLAEDTTITIIINQTWNKPSMETLAAAYEEANPGVKIDYQVIPDNEFGQLVNAKMAAKEVPEILMDNYQSLAKTVNMADTFVDIRDRAWYAKLVNKDQRAHRYRVVLESDTAGITLAGGDRQVEADAEEVLSLPLVATAPSSVAGRHAIRIRVEREDGVSTKIVESSYFGPIP